MNDKVLVTYATKYGATEEIAKKIAQVLAEAGLQLDVLPVSQVGDLTPYKAIVLGSAVYIGKWRKEAAMFLKNNRETLAGRMVWLFSSGPTGKGELAELLDGWNFPRGLQPVADRIKPRDITVFHGMLNMEKLNFIERWIIKKVKAPVGDFRNWGSITSYAKQIADTLRKNPHSKVEI